MKYCNLVFLFIACLASLFSCDSGDESNKIIVKSSNLHSGLDSLHSELTRISNETVIPGFAATLISGGEVIYSQGFGFSDQLNETTFSPQTVHVIASLSKTFVGLAIMQLVK